MREEKNISKCDEIEKINSGDKKEEKQKFDIDEIDLVQTKLFDNKNCILHPTSTVNKSENHSSSRA